MTRYYDRNGDPICWWHALERLTDDEYVTLATHDENGFRISTIWLGLDQAPPCWDGPPLIFETMIFGPGVAIEPRRYCTETQALAGHRETVAELGNILAGLDQDNPP